MLRLAGAHEADQVRDVVHAAYARYIPRIGKPPAPMLDDYAVRIARHQAWVLEAGDRIVGIVVVEAGADSCLLDNVAVVPECQGKGYSRRLIEFAMAEARRLGYPDGLRSRLYGDIPATSVAGLRRTTDVTVAASPPRRRSLQHADNTK